MPLRSPVSPHGHLTAAAMAELLNGSPHPEEGSGRVLGHLVSLCGTCCAVHDTVEAIAREFGHWDHVAALAETEEAPELWRRLEALPPGARAAAVESDESLQTWGLCRLLQRQSRDRAADQPQTAAELASLAVRICAHLGAAYDRDWIQDLAAASYAWLGNARRALGELHSAHDAFETARGLRRKGTGSPSVEAEALALEALLLRDRRLLRQAAAAFGAVAATHGGGGSTSADREATDAHLAGGAMAHQAWCLYHLGDQAAAPALLEAAAELVDEEREPRTILGIRQGRIWSAIVLGTPNAAALLPPATELAARLGDGAVRLRLRRAEARIAAEGGRRGPAEAILRAVLAEQCELCHGVDASLTLLDLAVVVIDRGATADEIAQLAQEAFAAFSSPDVQKLEMAALLWVQHACEEGRMTREIALALARWIERYRRPSLAWWAGWAARLGKETARDATATA